MQEKKSAKAGKADAGQTRYVENYLPYLLARASSLISEEFHRTLLEHQVPMLHWRVLVSLMDSPMLVKDLAYLVLEKQPTMSKIIDRMEKLGLVRRQDGQEDRRSTLVSITPKGTRIVKPLAQLAKQHERDVLEPLGEGNAKMLIEVLQKLIALHAR